VKALKSLKEDRAMAERTVAVKVKTINEVRQSLALIYMEANSIHRNMIKIILRKLGSGEEFLNEIEEIRKEVQSMK
jgi:hypothetical protein